ncbi:hypothetical protein GCM10023405_50630 [Streptomonospora salina]
MVDAAPAGGIGAQRGERILARGLVGQDCRRGAGTAVRSRGRRVGRGASWQRAVGAAPARRPIRPVPPVAGMRMAVLFASSGACGADPRGRVRFRVRLLHWKALAIEFRAS